MQSAATNPTSINMDTVTGLNGSHSTSTELGTNLLSSSKSFLPANHNSTNKRNYPMNIRIDTNKNGKKVAYLITNDLRNIRMNLSEAELLIATCKATSVTYGPNP